MLYYLLYPLRNVISGFNVFRYITFRTAWAALTALVICFILGPWLIERMRQIKLGQFIREEGPKSHQQKAGTPTMGGILINVAILIPTLLWADILNPTSGSFSSSRSPMERLASSMTIRSWPRRETSA